MKKLSLIIFVLILCQITVLSQTCLPEGISFTTQAQIDNFQSNNPGCTEIEGYVEINGDDINNLNGLTVLTSIVGDLTIGSILFGSNPALTNLSGLNNLASIGGGLRIVHNDALTSLSGLNNLASIGGDLAINNNDVLTSLSGVSSVTSIGGNLGIGSNDALTSLAGLDNIVASSIDDLTIKSNPSLSTCDVQSICNYLVSPNGTVEIYENATGCNNPPEIATSCGITLPCLPYGNYYFSSQAEVDNFQSNYPGCFQLEGNVEINGIDITNLDGLDILISLGGVLEIFGNDALTSLSGLENLTSIGGDLSIRSNDALTSLTGLDNIDAGTIENLHIYYNTLLSTCEVQSICDYIVSPNGTIVIHDNATGCNTQEEVEAACGVWVPDFNFESGISIYPNPAKDILTISSDEGITIEEVVIYNQIGKKVFEEELVNNTLDVSTLPRGMYVVELVSRDWKVRKKLIVGGRQ